MTKSVRRLSVQWMVIGGWIWSLLVSSPPLLGWGVYLPESNGMR